MTMVRLKTVDEHEIIINTDSIVYYKIISGNLDGLGVNTYQVYMCDKSYYEFRDYQSAVALGFGSLSLNRVGGE